MGLDMYLTGSKYFWSPAPGAEPLQKEDGFDVKTKELRLGYWRKHPNLHGYIVNTFANGEDDCSPIDLDADQMRQIIEAVKNKELPHTTGFFFGESDGSEDQETIAIFEKAIQWLEDRQAGASKSVIYQASW